MPCAAQTLLHQAAGVAQAMPGANLRKYSAAATTGGPSGLLVRDRPPRPALKFPESTAYDQHRDRQWQTACRPLHPTVRTWRAKPYYQSPTLLDTHIYVGACASIFSNQGYRHWGIFNTTLHSFRRLAWALKWREIQHSDFVATRVTAQLFILCEHPME